MIMLKGCVFPLAERIKHLLDVAQCVRKLASLFESVRECFDDGQQLDSVLISVREVGVGLELVRL